MLIDTLVFVVLAGVLGVLTGSMFFRSKDETLLSRVGFLIVSLGFLVFGGGILFGDPVTRMVATGIIGAGVITTGLGYEQRVPKVLHVVLGLVIYGVLISRYVI